MKRLLFLFTDRETKAERKIIIGIKFCQFFISLFEANCISPQIKNKSYGHLMRKKFMCNIVQC